MLTFSSRARSAARPAALDRLGSPSPAWLRLSLLILGLQIVAGLLSPGNGLVTCAGFAAQCVLAASFAGRRAVDDRLRWHWLTLAAALVCWAAGYVAIGVEEKIVGPEPVTGLFNDVLAMLKAAPLLLLLTAGLDASASRRLLRLDLAAMLIFALTAAVLMLGDPLGSGAPATNISILAVRDVENIALALLAMATLRVQRRTADRALYRGVAWLLGAYCGTATLLNHVLIARLPDAPGSAWLTIGAVPFALFHAATLVQPPPQGPWPRWAAPLRYLSPLLLAAASLLLAFAAARRGDPSGMVLGLAAVAIYAVRTSLERLEVRAANIDLRRTGRRLAAQAMTDTLTGVANRRKFDAALAEAWAEAERKGTALGVLFIDVDWFKPYNDSLGHAAGDACLQRLAQALDAAVGSPAIFARLGGEEFGVVVGVGGDAAVRHAERLRRLVEQMALPHPGSPLGHVTVSVGVASGIPGDTAATASDMLAAADRALYAAKAGGRNCVVAGRGRGA